MLIKKNPSFIQSYLDDSSNLKGGHAEGVAIPENPEEVSTFLKEANSKKIPVTISGAGTGQAGARIPFGGYLLSTEKLNTIKDIRKLKKGGTVIAESGVVINDLKRAALEKGLFYTYDPTEQAVFLGGTIATNASGARSFRYGPTRKHVKGLTLVLADGTIFSIKRDEIKAKARTFNFDAGKASYSFSVPSYSMPHTKNSAGYYTKDNMDLVDLFIGQEGTLAVIIEAELALLDRPKDIFSFFTFFKSEEAAWEFAEDAKNARPLSVEYFCSNCLRLLKNKYGNLPSGAKTAIFFEDEILDTEDTVLKKWEKLLEKHGISLDNTWVAMNEKTHRDFLDKRHFIPERMNEMARYSGFPKVSTDLAVPIEKTQSILHYYKRNLEKSNLEYFVFGHIGDAHLHVNMLPGSDNDYEKAKALQLDFVKKSIELGGTVSAEHGIGKTKREFLKLLYGEKGIKEMINVKKALDPNLILGRGNIFDIF